MPPKISEETIRILAELVLAHKGYKHGQQIVLWEKVKLYFESKNNIILGFGLELRSWVLNVKI